MNRNIQETRFIFEDQPSSLMCRDSITAHCSKGLRAVSFVDGTKTKEIDQVTDPSRKVEQEKRDIVEHVAKLMKNMSFQERQAALEEVNGIVDNDLETSMEDPAVLDRKLIELDDHLQKIKSGSLYEIAESMNPDYMQNRKFRLMFLRCKRYDSKGAAEHILGFLETKEWLFGREKLCKDITLNDLSEEERLLVRQGISQGLARDVGGRMITTYLRGMVKNNDIMAECRAEYYALMSLAESEESQIKGMVALLYVVGDYYKDNKGGDGWAHIGRMGMTVPIHWAGFHFCYDNPVSFCDIGPSIVRVMVADEESIQLQFVMIRAIVLVMSKQLAAKFRWHRGTHIECVYSLRTYGIPNSALPIPDTGANKPPLMYHHMIWYKNRERIDREKDSRLLGMKQQHGSAREQAPAATANIFPNDYYCDDDFSFIRDQFGQDLSDAPTLEENANQLQQLHETQTMLRTEPQVGLSQGSPNLSHGNIMQPNTIITPRRTDVLFGPKNMYHPGTMHLQEVVSQQLPVFESMLHRTDKIRFVAMLVQDMKASGKRFLTVDKDTNRCVEVDDKIARNKIAKMFRNKRRSTGLGPSFFADMGAPK